MKAKFRMAERILSFVLALCMVVQFIPLNHVHAAAGAGAVCTCITECAMDSRDEGCAVCVERPTNCAGGSAASNAALKSMVISYRGNHDHSVEIIKLDDDNKCAIELTNPLSNLTVQGLKEAILSDNTAKEILGITDLTSFSSLRLTIGGTVMEDDAYLSSYGFEFSKDEAYSYEISYQRLYHIDLLTTENGSITVDGSDIYVAAGENVTLTINLQTGYMLDTLTVKRGGTDVAVTNNCFIMPPTDVTVTATFKPCPHETYEAGICTACGYECPHSFDSTTGICANNCGTQAVAKVGEEFFITFDEALAAWANGGTMTLLTNVTYNSKIDLEGANNWELNLNNKTLERVFEDGHTINVFIELWGGELAIKDGTIIGRITTYSGARKLDVNNVHINAIIDDVTDAALFINENVTVNITGGSLTGGTGVLTDSPVHVYGATPFSSTYEDICISSSTGSVTFHTAPTQKLSLSVANSLWETPVIFPGAGVDLSADMFTSHEPGYVPAEDENGAILMTECDHTGAEGYVYTSVKNHRRTCSLCHVENGFEAHTVSDGVCTACGARMIYVDLGDSYSYPIYGLLKNDEGGSWDLIKVDDANIPNLVYTVIPGDYTGSVTWTCTPPYQTEAQLSHTTQIPADKNCLRLTGRDENDLFLVHWHNYPHDHSYDKATGICSGCLRECEHTWNEDSVCTVCGLVCLHSSHDLYHVCEACGFQIAHEFDKYGNCDCIVDCDHSSLDEQGVCQVCGMHKVYVFINEGLYISTPTIEIEDYYSDYMDSEYDDAYGSFYTGFMPVGEDAVYFAAADYLDMRYRYSEAFTYDGTYNAFRMTGFNDDGKIKLRMFTYPCVEHSYDPTDGHCADCGIACGHSFGTDNPVCTICGYSCPHEYFTEGVCDVCGYECPHAAFTNGNCDACGYQCNDHILDEIGFCQICDMRKIYLDVYWSDPIIYSTDPSYFYKRLTREAETNMWHVFVSDKMGSFNFQNPRDMSSLETQDLTLQDNANCYRVLNEIISSGEYSLTYDGIWYFYPCTQHDWENGECRLCGEVCSHTAEKTYNDNSDGTHDGVCNECDLVAVDNEDHNYVGGICACQAAEPYGVYFVSGGQAITADPATAYHSHDYVATLSSEQGSGIAVFLIMINGNAYSHWDGDFTYDAQTQQIRIPGQLVTGDIDIVANCTVKHTYFYNGGSFGEEYAEVVNRYDDESFVFEINYDVPQTAAVVMNYVQRTGYTVSGVKIGDAFYDLDDPYSGTEDLTLVFQWQANEYTATWDVEGTASTSTQTYDQLLTLPAEPTKEGCTFLGWFTEEEGGTKVTAETVYTIDGNTTYYARFCDHSGSNRDSCTYENGTEHSFTCSVCSDTVTETHTLALDYVNLEAAGHKAYYPCCQSADDVAVSDHVYDETTHLCPCGIVETFTVTVNDGNDSIVVSLTNTTATFGQDFTAELRSDVAKEPHYEIRYYTVNGEYYENATYENVKLTIPEENITGNIEIYVYPYVTVTFHGNGGVFKDPASGTEETSKVLVCEYGEEQHFLRQSSMGREGNSFVNFNTNPDGSGTAYEKNNEYIVTEDLELYAQWEANTYFYRVLTYTMNAYGNYGAPVTEAKSALYGTSVNAAPTSVAEGFYLDTENENSLLTATIPANNDLVLQVYIGRNQYPITWDLAGGTAENLEYLPEQELYDVTITIPTQIWKEGHTLSHFVDQTLKQYEIHRSSMEDIMDMYLVAMPAYGATFTAVWTVNAYTLQVQDQTLDVDYGTNLTDVLADITPEKTGHTFAGWTYYYLDEDGAEQPYTGTTMPAVELYAQPVYEAIEYNITWDMAGCTYHVSNYSGLPTKLAYNVDGSAHNVNFTNITAPEGYEFVRFEDGNGNALNCIVTDKYRLNLTVSGDMTIKAVVEPKSYVATWESSDGGSYEKEFKYGETITIPTSEIFQETFRKAGYTLVGWEGYTEGMTMPVDGVVFKAKWQINPASLDVTSAPYTGQAHTPTITVEGLTEGEDFTVEYPEDMVNVGEKIITVTGKLGGTTTVTYTIEKAAAPEITFPTVLNEIPYGAPLSEARLSFYTNNDGSFRWTALDGVPNAGTGSYALDFYPNNLALQNYIWQDTANAQWIESRSALCITAPVTVNKVEAEFEYPFFDQPNSPTYNAAYQTVITPGSTQHGTMVYSLSENGEYTEAIPMIKDAGEYKIWFKVIGDENHTDTQPYYVDVWMNKVPLWVTANDHAITYGDAPDNGGVTYEGFVGGDTAADLDGELTYTYTYTQYGDVGTYEITPAGLESVNYTALYTPGTLTVEPKPIDEASAALNGSLTYNGSEQTQKVAAAEGVTVSVTGNKAMDAGTYVLTITGTGNYTGTVTKTWSIAKAPQRITVQENLKLSCKETAQLVVQAEGALTFASSDAAIVTVDASGKLTAKKVGSAVITVSAAETENYLAAQTTTQITVKHAHEAVVTAPTCEDKGYTTYICACGDEYVADYVDAKDHDYDGGVITTQSGCETEGIKTFTCANDATHTYTEKVSSTGHSPKAAVEENRVNATCTAKGSCEMVVYCGACHKELSRTEHTIDAIGHDYDGGVITTQPGCETEGIKTFTCSNDESHTHTEKVTAKGHSHEKTVTAPTCEAKGYTTYTCACGDSYVKDYTGALGHVFTDDWDESCNVCGKVREIMTIPMYRLYNPNTGEHFYTGSMEERDNLVEVGWNYEGIAWNAPVYFGDPVYRFFNPNTGDHHYTTDLDECASVRAAGWIYEGVAWNSAPDTGVPIYRLYNPNAETGIHHYTSSEEERDWLVSLGWKYEGVGWYGLMK